MAFPLRLLEIARDLEFDLSGFGDDELAEAVTRMRFHAAEQSFKARLAYEDLDRELRLLLAEHAPDLASTIGFSSSTSTSYGVSWGSSRGGSKSDDT